MQEWFVIKGFEGLYEINKAGRIKSFQRKVPIILKEYVNLVGYVQVTLGRKNKLLVHKIMATTFLENPNNKQTVNHINGIKTDNRIENLEWSTYSENNKHAYATKLKIPYLRNGEMNPRNKFKKEDILEIRRMIKDGVPYNNIMSIFKISRGSVSGIKYGRTWAWLP